MNTLDLGPYGESDPLSRPGGKFGGLEALILKTSFMALPFVKKLKPINLKSNGEKPSSSCMAVTVHCL